MTEDGTLSKVSDKFLHIESHVDEDESNGRHLRHPPITELQILKNVGIIGLAFMCLFTAFQSLQNLQSTLNKEEGLGTGGLAIVYGSLVISCLFLPTFTIARIGCKWTMAASMVCYVVYMAANFHAVWGLIVPASIILGMGAAPLWSSKCTYLTQLAVWYSRLKGVTEDDVINRFFGFFFMAFQTSQVWGNLMSSLIFSNRGDNVTSPTKDVLSTCGASYLPREYSVNNTNLDRPEITKVYTLCGIYLSCAVVAFLVVIIFLDNIELDTDKRRKGDKSVSAKLLVETFRQWRRSKAQKLLVPLTIYSGLQQVFIAADFTKSYISCTLGIWNVGYIMICYGVVDAVCSFLFGRLVQCCGHIPFFALAFFVQGGIQICLLVWRPDPSQVVLFYVIAAVWAIGDAVIQTQLNSFYGYLFTTNTEAAFANYRLWESLGFIIAFAYSNYFYTSTKLYICLIFLVVGMSSYVMVELMDRRKRMKQLLEKQKDENHHS